MAATVRDAVTYDNSHNTYPTPIGTRVYVWSGLDGDDTGKPVKCGDLGDKTVQIFGTHGGATTVLQGTDDVRGDPNHPSHASAVWKTLTDTTETAISATADSENIQVLQNPLWIRPAQTGGTGGDLTVTLTCSEG